MMTKRMTVPMALRQAASKGTPCHMAGRVQARNKVSATIPRCPMFRRPSR